MRHWAFVVWIVAGILICWPTPAPAATSKQVEDAIKKAKEFLINSQREGNWESAQKRMPEPRPNALGQVMITDIINSNQWGGTTALVTYALLASGESAQEPRMAESLKWLSTHEINGTYAIAMRAQLWYLMPPGKRKEFAEVMKKDREILITNMRGGKSLLGGARRPPAGGGPMIGPGGVDPNEEFKGFYRYTADDNGYDHSASQFGVLGMWALEQAGMESPNGYWKIVEDAWLKDQDKATGGWNYGPLFRPMQPITPTMTAAGVATLFITQDYLHMKDALDCKGNISNKAIEAGMKWMTTNFNQVFKSEWPFYALYGVERIGLASGYKYLGTIDWYEIGSDKLVGLQQPDGGWGTAFDTSFALLFLVRGRAPVVMNKLEYAIDFHGEKNAGTNWNERPRDAANVTRWMSRQFERDLNWQIVNLKGSVDDLHDAPILYITGNQVLNLTAEDEAKLKEFVNQGGLILGNADCGHLGFATSFKKLGAKLFPPGEFKELPAGHIVFNNFYQRSKWKGGLSVQGLNNGARELMILFASADPSRIWQTGTYGAREEAWQFLANLYLYMSEKKDFRFKGDTYILKPDANVQASKTAKLARLQYAGNWDPEPGSWKRESAVLHNEAQLDLTVETIRLGEGKLAGYKLAHLTSTNKFKLSDKEREELKAFIAGGGTLIADACGGNGEAANSLETELAALSTAKIDILKQDHPLYTGLGMPADKIEYRPFASKQHLGGVHGPRLRGAEVNNKLAIIYSPEDLSVGMVGQAVDGIIGYTPASSAALMKAVVVYASGQ